jgi:hypothetical protein
MRFSAWFKNCRRFAPTFRRHSPRRRRPNYGPPIEALECRTLLTAYAAATAAQLVADIKAANTSGGTNTITLTAPATSPYVLSAVNNTTDGPTALPVIKKGDNLTIVTGNGSTSPGFGDTIDPGRVGRLFDVASGASLTLKNVTLQNGFVFGSGASAEGGAIFNHGTLVLNQVMVQGNTAEGFPGSTSQQNKPGGAGQDAAGGGIWCNGSLRLENGTVIQDNSALGGDGGTTSLGTGPGGKAFGGGIYIAGGTADITTTTLGAYSAQFGNKAQGGAGDNTSSNLGGAAYGGAVYVAAGTVAMSGDTVGTSEFPLTQQTQNVAQGGAVVNGFAAESGLAYGGGIYVASGSVTLTGNIIEGNVAGTFFSPLVDYIDGFGGGVFIAPVATVSLDNFTVGNTIDNSDSSGNRFGPTANIDGKYILQ